MKFTEIEFFASAVNENAINMFFQISKIRMSLNIVESDTATDDDAMCHPEDETNLPMCDNESKVFAFLPNCHKKTS